MIIWDHGSSTIYTSLGLITWRHHLEISRDQQKFIKHLGYPPWWQKSTCIWERREASFVDKKTTVIDVDFLSTNDAPQHSQKQIFGFHVDFCPQMTLHDIPGLWVFISSFSSTAASKALWIVSQATWVTPIENEKNTLDVIDFYLKFSNISTETFFKLSYHPLLQYSLLPRHPHRLLVQCLLTQCLLVQ